MRLIIISPIFSEISGIGKILVVCIIEVIMFVNIIEDFKNKFTHLAKIMPC